MSRFRLHPRPTARLGLLAALAWLAGDPVQLAAAAPPKPDRMGVVNTGPYDYGVMGPPATPAVVAAAAQAITHPMAPGPMAPTWDSVQANYRTPSWFQDAKFGIFMHWGLYSVPAHGPSAAEWYEKHMYAGAATPWHEQNFGPIEKFGYKDFIPLFTAAKWDPDAWALLFKQAGARLVMPTAEHHDNFAMWDSAVTPINAKKMGPKRDLIGDLAVAVRKQGLKFGVSNHGIENFTFVVPDAALDARLKAAKADLYDPAWATFYHVADRSDAAMSRFLTDWVNRNEELIDQYQPDMIWFDNGVNLRVLDPLKLRVAAYYYNRAKGWDKEVSLGTKFNAYSPSNDDTKQIGSIVDFEKVGGRSPAGIRPGPWMVDDPIGSTWGYSTGMTVSGPAAILGKLIDTVSKGGFYLLNISPMADGTIPDAQQKTLLEMGAWLDQNGEAIYGTHPWIKFSEAGSGSRGSVGYHFTVKDGALYVIGSAWAGAQAHVASVGTAVGQVEKVGVLGSTEAVTFKQDATGLTVNLPAAQPGRYGFVLKISGLNVK